MITAKEFYMQSNYVWICKGNPEKDCAEEGDLQIEPSAIEEILIEFAKIPNSELMNITVSNKFSTWSAMRHKLETFSSEKELKERTGHKLEIIEAAFFRHIL